MKIPALSLAAAALLLSACAKDKPLSLPDQPVDRAATCGIVAAANARVQTTDIKKPLTLAAQGRILHYALLAGSESGAFDPQVSNQVVQRMPQLEAGVTQGKWQPLVAACAEAYPAAEKTDPSLPANRTDALLACDELDNFLLVALEKQNSEHANEIAEYRQFKYKLDAALVAGLRARAGASPAAQRAERNKALARAASLGSPVPVLEACGKKFG